MRFSRARFVTLCQQSWSPRWSLRSVVLGRRRDDPGHRRPRAAPTPAPTRRRAPAHRADADAATRTGSTSHR